MSLYFVMIFLSSSDYYGNPEDRFSHVTAQLDSSLHQLFVLSNLKFQLTVYSVLTRASGSSPLMTRLIGHLAQGQHYLEVQDPIATILEPVSISYIVCYQKRFNIFLGTPRQAYIYCEM